MVCEEPCVVYTWTFDDIHTLLANEPISGAHFEMCILLDLNKKMTSTRTQEALLRYKQLLECSLLDNEISIEKKKYIEKFRKENMITVEDSDKLVRGFVIMYSSLMLCYNIRLRNWAGPEKSTI